MQSLHNFIITFFKLFLLIKIFAIVISIEYSKENWIFITQYYFITDFHNRLFLIFYLLVMGLFNFFDFFKTIFKVQILIEAN